jgi:hypothetical protein
VALACGAAFVRVEGFVFAHVADEGLVEAAAGPLLRYRAAIAADQVRVFADIKKKHASHAITADLDIAETARAAEFALADGVIVTGTATGRPADPAEVVAVAGAVGIPTLVGSGVTAGNVASFAAADGLIVGSSVKQRGDWRMPLERCDDMKPLALSRRLWRSRRSCEPYAWRALSPARPERDDPIPPRPRTSGRPVPVPVRPPRAPLAPAGPPAVPGRRIGGGAGRLSACSTRTTCGPLNFVFSSDPS